MAPAPRAAYIPTLFQTNITISSPLPHYYVISSKTEQPTVREPIAFRSYGIEKKMRAYNERGHRTPSGLGRVAHLERQLFQNPRLEDDDIPYSRSVTVHRAATTFLRFYTLNSFDIY